MTGPAVLQGLKAGSAGQRHRRRFEVSGVVQGVGFRPFVYVTASELALSGFVRNSSAGVLIEVEGSPDAVEELSRRLLTGAPPLAVIESIRQTEMPPRGGTDFTIEESTQGHTESRTLASPDVATCDECLGEMCDPANRRHRHPFITCTSCGPRFTIILDLPYDRAATTMASYDLCDACRQEYEDPADRRFHAQPIACPDCGPVLELVRKKPGITSRGEDALTGARDALAHRACERPRHRGLGLPGSVARHPLHLPRRVDRGPRRERDGQRPGHVRCGPAVHVDGIHPAGGHRA